MSFNSEKYDIELNLIPYRITGYSKSESPSFVPRVASGGQTETEFNSLLSKTLRGFAGGILQRRWQNDESVFATEGLYPIYEDGVLYPVNAEVSRTDLGTGRPIFNAFCKTKDYLFIAWQSTTGGAAQGIKRIDSSGTVVSLTVPTNISNQTYLIRDMVIWRNQLWVSAVAASTLTGSMYYMDLTATTLNDITSGDAATFFWKMVVFKDAIYGTNTIVSTNHAISKYTGSTTSKSYEVVGTTPAQYASLKARLFIFNNRIHLARNDGLYAYDGIQLVTISDNTDTVDDQNYLHATVLLGYMYYFMPDGFYRYSGSIIEKLYDVSEVGIPTDMCAGKNRLWLSYSNSAYLGSSRYDKSMGYDYSTGTNVDGRVAVFNGRAMYTYQRTNTFIKSGSPLLANEGENDRVVWFKDKLYILTYAEPSNTQFTIDTAERSASGQKTSRIVTSIFDGDFPMVDKSLENLELVFDGNVSADENVTVEYRIGGFDGSTGWTSLGTIKTITEKKRQVWKTISAGVVFRSIQFRLVGATTAGYGVAKIIVRYTLTPDFKWQWQFVLNAFGGQAFEPLMLSDQTKSTQLVSDLRGNAYLSRSSDIPVLFVDIDKLDLNGAHNASTTTITVNTTALLRGDDGFIKIDDELCYWYAKTATTLTVIRGVLGTTGASHSDNAKVYLAYRVNVASIQSERVEMQEGATRVAEDYTHPSEITLLLREV